jgi:hypothetical protein
LGKTRDPQGGTMTVTTHVDEVELPRRLLNITELAERRIPFIKWGHLIRFDPIEVVRWLDGHRRRPERSA